MRLTNDESEVYCKEHKQRKQRKVRRWKRFWQRYQMLLGCQECQFQLSQRVINNKPHVSEGKRQKRVLEAMDALGYSPLQAARQLKRFGPGI